VEALFSERREKKLQRDNSRHVFLDVNSVVFRAIVDYLNEMSILLKDNPPESPSVDHEHKHFLKHHLELFGILASQMWLLLPRTIRCIGCSRIDRDWREKRTAYLLSDEIKKLETNTQDVATLIEHSPHCFCKILDYLRLKQFHA